MILIRTKIHRSSSPRGSCVLRQESQMRIPKMSHLGLGGGMLLLLFFRAGTNCGDFPHIKTSMRVFLCNGIEFAQECKSPYPQLGFRFALLLLWTTSERRYARMARRMSQVPGTVMRPLGACLFCSVQIVHSLTILYLRSHPPPFWCTITARSSAVSELISTAAWKNRGRLSWWCRGLSSLYWAMIFVLPNIIPLFT